MHKGGDKATKIIQILKNEKAGLKLQDSIRARGLLAVPRGIANIVASNRGEAKNWLTNTEADGSGRGQPGDLLRGRRHLGGGGDGH